LREEGLLWLQLDDPPSQAGFCQKFAGVKCSFLKRSHLNVSFPKAAMPGGNSDEHATASDME
jgi:hypothetical protein